MRPRVQVDCWNRNRFDGGAQRPVDVLNGNKGNRLRLSVPTANSKAFKSFSCFTASARGFNSGRKAAIITKLSDSVEKTFRTRARVWSECAFDRFLFGLGQTSSNPRERTRASSLRYFSVVPSNMLSDVDSNSETISVFKTSWFLKSLEYVAASIGIPSRWILATARMK